MLITAITPQKHKKDRVNIFIDNRFAFALDLEAVVKNKIKAGSELTQNQIDFLVKDNEFSKWFNRALKFLSFRPRSKKEVADFLKRKEAGNETSNRILEKLEEKKLVDDLEFAKWFIEQRKTFRPKGKRALAIELRQKGIEREIIDEVISHKVSFGDELILAKKISERKNSLWKNLNREERQRKLTNLLLRRGFGWDIVNKILKKPEVLNDV